MATRKDGSVQNLDEGRNTDLSRQDELTSDSRRGAEDDADTENVSGDVEEGEEDFDDEELSEEDFDVDDDDLDDEDEEDDEEEIG
jgi:hypothetical protein